MTVERQRTAQSFIVMLRCVRAKRDGGKRAPVPLNIYYWEIHCPTDPTYMSFLWGTNVRITIHYLRDLTLWSFISSNMASHGDPSISKKDKLGSEITELWKEPASFIDSMESFYERQTMACWLVHNQAYTRFSVLIHPDNDCRNVFLLIYWSKY